MQIWNCSKSDVRCEVLDACATGLAALKLLVLAGCMARRETDIVRGNRGIVVFFLRMNTRRTRIQA